MNATRAFWLRQLHTWHWISAALSLSGILLFAATGLTLQHAGLFTSPPTTSERQGQLPPALQAQLTELPTDGEAPLTGELPRWVRQQLALDIAHRLAEFSPDEIYLRLATPGADASLSIDRHSGDIHYQQTHRGAIAYLNDLHKGRNAGSVWFWFVDALAIACIVFSLTGLALLWLHGKGRPSTWPITGLGLLMPVLIALLLIH